MTGTSFDNFGIEGSVTCSGRMKVPQGRNFVHSNLPTEGPLLFRLLISRANLSVRPILKAAL